MSRNANAWIERRKVLLFYNPNAGNGLFKNNLDHIIERFQQAELVVIPMRAGRSDLLDLAFESIDPREYRQVIAAGGDGTINICVNAMMRHGIDLPLAIFPAGTANDFAYCLDLPLEIDAMIDIALGDHFIVSDLGKANDRYFLNVAAMGTMVDVSQKTDPNVKSVLGVLSYYIRGLVEMPNLKPIPVRIDSREFSGEEMMYFMIIMNGRSAGGFKRLSPNAEINDGLLDVIIFREMPLTDFFPLLINVLQGNHEKNKNIIFFRTDRLKVESAQHVGTDMDGERGDDLPVQYSLIPGRLRIHTQDPAAL